MIKGNNYKLKTGITGQNPSFLAKFLIEKGEKDFILASRPINFIRTFALLATAEYCFSCIALNIAVSRVHTNFAVISGRFKLPSSISSFSKR